MKPRDIAELLALAALWGGSFLFMRMGAAEFGAFALAGLRVGGAALALLPVILLRGEWPALRRHWGPIFLVGITNSALPFLAFSYAALTLPAGLSSILNAATPLFGALIAWLWLGDRLNRWRSAGLVVGFVGVVGLILAKSAPQAGGGSPALLASLACVGAAVCYGFSASFAKRFLHGVPPFAVAGGSQLSAALALAVPTLLSWPATPPSAQSWWAVALLALLSTAVAYVLFFDLLKQIGPANAISVTFQIPAFAVLWGWMFLGEPLTAAMGVGCTVILAGTALATGVLPRRRVTRA